jgi:predicted component of type VI protein secretion system
VADDALDILVAELLLERTKDFDPRQLAAYVDAWTGLLDLMRRTQLILPRGEPELHDALSEVVERIRAATARTLDDGTG